MSIRKFISLLLSVAFVMTTVTPANATVTFNSGVTLPVLAQDEGNASDGANKAAVPLQLKIGFAGGDLVFASDGTDFADDDDLTVSDNGIPAVTTATIPNPRVMILVPPTGTKFVKLTSKAYTNTATAVNWDINNGANIFSNVTIDAATRASFPGTGTNGFVVATIIGSTGASNTTYGTSASTEFPMGSLVLNFGTAVDAPNNITSGAGGSIVVNGLGLAADAGTSLGDSGDLNITYKEPNTSATAQEAFASLNDGDTIKIGTLASHLGKTEFLIAGEATGNETAGVAEDTQSNTILASQITGSTVKVGPGYITSTGTSLSTANLDIDTQLLRAAETSVSTTGAPEYYDPAMATSAFVTSDGATTASVLRDTADATDLNQADPTSTSLFPNTSNALMTITYSLEAADGSASSATLAVDAVTVSMVGPRAFNGFRNRTSALGGETAALTRVMGFLGSVANPTTGADADTDLGIAVAYNNADNLTEAPELHDTNPLDFTAQTTVEGVADATINTLQIQAGGDTPTAVQSVSPWSPKITIFPGSLVLNNPDSTASNWDLVNVANGSGATPFSFGLTTGGDGDASSDTYANTNTILNPAELSVKLRNSASGAAVGSTGNTAWWFLAGDATAGNNSAANSIEIASTNLNTSALAYDNGSTAKGGAGAQVTPDAANNAFMVARLAANVLRILPIVDKLDCYRDVIAIRPEMTITLDAAAKSAGVNIVATATGGNLPSSGVKKVIGKILPVGGLTPGIDLTAMALPTHGDISNPRLMREKSDDPALNRASIDLDGVTGASTSADGLEDLIGSSNVLDETLPPLFCGGTAGTGTRGPNRTVFQPKGRAVLLTDNGNTGFKEIADLGSNTVIRVTLPEGWDINNYTATSSNFIAVEDSAGITASIARVQHITSSVTRAFVDISISGFTATTVNIKRLVALFFKPNALVVPSSVTGFEADVEIINNAGTTATTDDSLVGTIGKVKLGEKCEKLLKVEFCPDAISSFIKSGTTTATDENGRVNTNKSIRTTFSDTLSTATRVVNSTPGTVTLPDLCISEMVPDALSIGSINDGIPDQFGEQTTTAIGEVELHLATNLPIRGTTDTVGFNSASLPGASSLLFSDTSIIQDGAPSSVAGADGNHNHINIPLREGTASGRDRPFEAMTTIRIPGLNLFAADSNQVVTAQDIFAWQQAPAGGGTTYVIGTDTPIGQENINTTTNEHAFTNVINGAEDEEFSNFFSDLAQDSSAGTVVQTDFGDADATAATNDVNLISTAANPCRLSNGVDSVLDTGSAFNILDEDTDISIQVSEDATEGDNIAVVSGQPGSLEPGSTVAVTTSGSGNADSVTVPVGDDGSFKASLRCGSSQKLVLTQAPTSLQTGALQVREFDCANSNVDPKITGATAKDIGLGEITARGQLPVVFTVESLGILDGANYVPTASNLTLGGNPVTAVEGSTTMFIGVVDFSKSTGTTVTSTAGGTTSSVTLSGLSTANPTLKGRPVVRKVRENKKGNIVVRGRRLRDGTFGFLKNDGTLELVDLRKRTRGDRQKNRRVSASGGTIPSNAVHVIYHVPGRGVDGLEVN